MLKKKKLTYKQKLFCNFYIEKWNATDAAKRAGYSEKTAFQIGTENLKKPYIQEYITEIQKDIEKTSEISKLRILNELKKLAFAGETEQNSERLKSIEIIIKMLGYNEPEKIDLTADVKQKTVIKWGGGEIEV